MEETELNVENDETSPTNLESNTLIDNVERTPAPITNTEMSRDGTTSEESQDENIDSQRKKSAPTD